MSSKKWDLYKHRDLHTGKEWQYSGWIDSYRGPYNSLVELADNLPSVNPHGVKFVFRRTRGIISGTQISSLSDDELAEVYGHLLDRLNRNQNETVQEVGV